MAATDLTVEEYTIRFVRKYIKVRDATRHPVVPPPAPLTPPPDFLFTPSRPPPSSSLAG